MNSDDADGGTVFPGQLVSPPPRGPLLFDWPRPIPHRSLGFLVQYGVHAYSIRAQIIFFSVEVLFNK